MYRSPATLAFLLSEVMPPPLRGTATCRTQDSFLKVDWRRPAETQMQ